ncbi:histone deacetylase complex subunit SAP130 [Neocloeon triangulifer]|uniref:histone deacetylase complex subunit SAP130 n=1 Tax=Neocloeon triangulifer TaxID=2078957 RepID=UPI00286F1032|nr:histone deacetylase complex subunit SAP130 [Neocloeon triangulifer]
MASPVRPTVPAGVPPRAEDLKVAPKTSAESSTMPAGVRATAPAKLVVGAPITASTAVSTAKTISTARIVTHPHPAATTLTLIGSGTAAGLIRPVATASVTSFHISKAAVTVAPSTRNVVTAPLVTGFSPGPIITATALPTQQARVRTPAATQLTAGANWLSKAPSGSPVTQQARITTYPLGQAAIRPTARPLLATLSKQDLPTIRTLTQVDKSKARPGVPAGTPLPLVKPTEVAHLAPVVVTSAKTVVATAISKIPQPGPAIQIAHLTNIKGAPGSTRTSIGTFSSGPTQVKVLGSAETSLPSTAPATVISSGSLLIHNTLTGERTAGGPNYTLPASYFYEPGQQLVNAGPGSRIVMTPVTTAATAVPIKIEEKKLDTIFTSADLSSVVKSEHEDRTDESGVTTPLGSPTKLCASPRPSILRKRDHEGSPVKNLKGALQALSSPPASPPHSSKPDSDDGKDNSSGGSSTISATSSPGLLDIENMAAIKSEPADVTDAPEPVSPRKKPRKQQLTGNELQEVVSPEEPEEKRAKAVGVRRRSAILLPNYRTNAKLCHNHFRRPTDVRVREERRPTVAELSSQRGVSQKARGWKLYHLSTQMEVMSERESEILDRLGNMLDAVDDCSTTAVDTGRTSELIRTNMQRSKVVRDQLDDCRNQLLKLLEHGAPVLDIIKRNANRRQAKKPKY